MPHHEGDLRVHPDARFAILASRWNPRIVDALVESARATFLANGVLDAAIDVVRVPGAWELPVIARQLAQAGGHAAIVALGCVVRGDTRHYEQVADGASDGLMRVALDTGVPVMNGVLAVEKFEDALARAGGSHGNKGEEAALVAIEMADLRRKLQEQAWTSIPIDVPMASIPLPALARAGARCRRSMPGRSTTPTNAR